MNATYTVIDTTTGVSFGLFGSLNAAELFAQEHGGFTKIVAHTAGNTL